ncbi:hypothetical protein KKH13_04260, partial [Patescibacteria group bacterium]|nr:hypothetical protein [Patescibacteria group bacterium]
MEVVKPIISGISHCCHHDVHYEWCTDYDGRVGFIKKNKPENEQALRLRLFQIVPAGKLTLICKEAAEAYRAAWEVHHEAWEAYCKALG